MTTEELRIKIKHRIIEKKHISGSGSLATEMGKTMAEYNDLSLVEKDFAFRSIMTPRTLKYWAAYYNLAYLTIWRLSRDPRVVKLQQELQSNVRKYMISSQLYLMKEAMLQFKDIFEVHGFTAEMMEVKRKAANDVLERGGVGKRVKDDEDGKTSALNVNIFNNKSELDTYAHSEEGDSPNTLNVTVEQLEKDMVEVKELADLRTKAAHYGQSKDKDKRKGSGFGGEDAPDVALD